MWAYNRNVCEKDKKIGRVRQHQDRYGIYEISQGFYNLKINLDTIKNFLVLKFTSIETKQFPLIKIID